MSPARQVYKTVNTSNLFRIAENLYGMVVGQVSLYFGENINHSNKLILFDKNGSIYETLNLSIKDQNYSVITSRENEFEIVSNYETRRFKIILHNGCVVARCSLNFRICFLK
jgi:hypothetical protein